MPARVFLRAALVAALLSWIPSPALAQRGDPTKNDPKVHEAFRGIIAKVNGQIFNKGVRRIDADGQTMTIDVVAIDPSARETSIRLVFKRVPGK